MNADTSIGAAALGVKTGVLGGVIAGVILIAASILGTIVGFKIVPPVKGRELDDISTRLLCGMLSSCTIGVYAAYRYIKYDPDWLTFWMHVYSGYHEQFIMALASAVLPFVLLSSLPGFWVVAGFMHFARRNIDGLSKTKVGSK